MARYTVAFDVNGTVHTIQCSQTKVGNRYLQCMREIHDETVKVAFVPFDAIEYIVHDAVGVQPATGTPGAGGE